MTRNVTVAAIQSTVSANVANNLDKAIELVIEAQQQGAQIILLQELFAFPYFCKTQDPAYFEWAEEIDKANALQALSLVAQEYQVVLPVSFFQRVHNAFYNALTVIDTDGSIGEVYHKSHIPDGPGYQEKFYFKPGQTGFKVWNTKYAKMGCGICWDQWFPEAARVMSLQGAELLFYPTAIGSEPQAPEMDTQGHWQRTMQGHAAANMVPVIAANRIGKETQQQVSIDFYGSSFITDHTGEIKAQASRTAPEIVLHTLDLEAAQHARQSWGVYRDRRTELYREIVV